MTSSARQDRAPGRGPKASHSSGPGGINTDRVRLGQMAGEDQTPGGNPWRPNVWFLATDVFSGQP